jgi:hypothetical protein
MVVSPMQGLHDHQGQLPGLAGAELADGLAELRQAHAPPKHASEAIRMDVIERQELFGVLAVRGRDNGPL